MEEMATGPGGQARRAGGTRSGSAPRDLRQWIAAVDAIGQLKRITEPVSREIGRAHV